MQDDDKGYVRCILNILKAKQPKKNYSWKRILHLQFTDRTMHHTMSDEAVAQTPENMTPMELIL